MEATDVTAPSCIRLDEVAEAATASWNAGARSRLVTAIEAAKERAHSAPALIGVDDCVLWVASVYAVALLRDPAAEFRGRYSTPTQAAVLMSGQGLGPTVMRIARRMKWRRIKPAAAQVGDFALIEIAGEVNAAIFDGQLWIRRIDGGYGGYPAEFVRKAWCVT